MKSYKKTYGLEAWFLMMEVMIILCSFCPAIFIVLAFEEDNILIAFLQALAFPLLAFGIVFIIWGMFLGIVNLFTHLIQKPAIFLTEESIKYHERERFFKHIERVEFKRGYRTTPNTLTLIPKFDYHQEIEIDNPPLKIILFLKNKFGLSFIDKDKKSDKIFRIIIIVVGIILAIIALIYKLN